MRKIVRILTKHHPTLKDVVDSTQDRLLQVTKRESELGEMLDPVKCALSLAGKTQGWDTVIVSNATAYLVKDDIAYRHNLSNKTRKAMKEFDGSSLFEQGSFGLLAPRPANQLGKKRRDRSAYPRKKTKRNKDRRIMRSL